MLVFEFSEKDNAMIIQGTPMSIRQFGQWLVEMGTRENDDAMDLYMPAWADKEARDKMLDPENKLVNSLKVHSISQSKAKK